MIKALHLKNFQCHKDKTIEFKPGINAIVGESDSGKTALYRAMELVRNNKPDGTDFITHNEKKCEVTIDYDDCTISRIKGSVNQYTLDDKVFSAFGRNIPQEISEKINMSEVNVHSQYDQHFFLSMSSGEQSKYFNQILNLEQIDVLFKGLSSDKRKNTAELLEIKETIDVCLQKQAKLDDFKILLDKWCSKSDKCYSLEDNLNKQNKAYDDLIETQYKIDKLKDDTVYTTVLNMYDLFVSKKNGLDSKESIIKDLQDKIEQIYIIKQTQDKYAQKIKNTEEVIQLQNVYNEKATVYTNNANKLKVLSTILNDYTVTYRVINTNNIINSKLTEIIGLFNDYENKSENYTIKNSNLVLLSAAKLSIQSITDVYNKNKEKINTREKELNQYKGKECPLCGNTI